MKWDDEKMFPIPKCKRMAFELSEENRYLIVVKNMAERINFYVCYFVDDVRRFLVYKEDIERYIKIAKPKRIPLKDIKTIKPKMLDEEPTYYLYNGSRISHPICWRNGQYWYLYSTTSQSTTGGGW